MIIKDKNIEDLPQADKENVTAALSIIDKIMMQNNLDFRAAILDANGSVMADSVDDYEAIASGRIKVEGRRETTAFNINFDLVEQVDEDEGV